MFSGIKRNTTDKLFSDIVRLKAQYICERCLRDFKDQKWVFDVAHFITRGNKRTRWDAENVAALCRGCHDYFGKNPYQHNEFMKNKLGEGKLLALIVRSQRQLNDLKIDEKLVRQGLKMEWKRMQAEEKKNILGAR